MAAIGQPFGLTRPFSNRSVYNCLFKSFTESSNVSSTICGTSSTGRSPAFHSTIQALFDEIVMRLAQENTKKSAQCEIMTKTHTHRNRKKAYEIN